MFIKLNCNSTYYCLPYSSKPLIIYVWAFSNVHCIPLRSCQQKSLIQTFLSISHPLTHFSQEMPMKIGHRVHLPFWIMPRCKTEGKATLWLRFPTIKREGSGDQSWVRFWISSCAKLDFVRKFLDWHLEQFPPKHKCWLKQHLNLWKYSKSRLRICSEFF